MFETVNFYIIVVNDVELIVGTLLGYIDSDDSEVEPETTSTEVGLQELQRESTLLWDSSPDTHDIGQVIEQLSVKSINLTSETSTGHQYSTHFSISSRSLTHVWVGSYVWPMSNALKRHSNAGLSHRPMHKTYRYGVQCLELRNRWCLQILRPRRSHYFFCSLIFFTFKWVKGIRPPVYAPADMKAAALFLPFTRHEIHLANSWYREI